MSNSDHRPRPTREEIACRALNEHGFLLQSRVADTFLAGYAGHWKLTALEVPVAPSPTLDETRIDFVLEREAQPLNVRWHLCVECKRSSPDYKTWLFFDSRARLLAGPPSLFFQAGDLLQPWDNQGDVPLARRVIHFRAPGSLTTDVFNYYVEARENPPDKQGSSSSTKTIEDAFRQATLGVVGLSTRLWKMKDFKFRVVPVVVTTAEIFAAEFTQGNVSLDRGQIAADKFKLRSVDWTCVNYAISASLADAAQLTSMTGRNLGEELAAKLLRSVFVVRSTKLDEFLKWFDGIVDSNPH